MVPYFLFRVTKVGGSGKSHFHRPLSKNRTELIANDARLTADYGSSIFFHNVVKLTCQTRRN